MKEAKTVDGLVFAYDGELTIGTAIMDITSGTATPIMDGEYTMEDGNVVKILSGVVAVSIIEKVPADVGAPDEYAAIVAVLSFSVKMVSLLMSVAKLTKFLFTVSFANKISSIIGSTALPLMSTIVAEIAILYFFLNCY